MYKYVIELGNGCSDIPFAQFRFANAIVKHFTPDSFYAAVERGYACACGDCSDCAALEYHVENNV